MTQDTNAKTSTVCNAFSVDVEDYFQVSAFESIVSRESWPTRESRVERNTARILDLLERHETRGTFFVLGWVAENAPGVVREICERGHELASHGYDHRRVTNMSPEEFRLDIRKTKQLLEDTAGVQVRGYRAPSFSVVKSTLWALEILQEEGYLYDSSIFPIRHDRYGIPDYPRFPLTTNGRQEKPGIVEFPISTVAFLGRSWPFVGGGFLRQFPIRYIEWGIGHLNSVERHPTVLYVHPWELDPDQPRQPVGWLTRIRHYRNLNKTEALLDRLLRRFEFGTMQQVLTAAGFPV